MSLKDNAISGVKWTTLATITTTIVGILRISILTRVLDKSDFGIVAIVTFVLGLTQMFADLGFSSALMHVKNLSKKQFCSLYWIQFFIFIAFYAIISCLSIPISRFYDESILIGLLPIALLDLLLNGIGRLYGTLIQKEFQFKTIAIRNIVSSLASLIVAVVLAIMGFGVYSLVLSTLSQTFIVNIWNFIAGQSKQRIAFFISLSEVKNLFKIGIYQTLTGIVDYIGGRLDVLIIGKLLGTEALGVLSICKELIIKVYTLINNIANNVTLPVFAKLQEDINGLQVTYCKVIKGLTFVTFPVLVTLAVFGEPFVTVLYGEKFIGTGLLFSILVISYFPACVVNPAGPLAIALGRTDLSFLFTIFKLILAFPLTYFAAQVDLIAVAIAHVLITLLSFCISYLLVVKKCIELPFLKYCSSFSKNAIFSIVTGLITFIVLLANPLNISNAYLELFVYGSIATLLCIISSTILISRDSQLISLVPLKYRKYICKYGK